MSQATGRLLVTHIFPPEGNAPFENILPVDYGPAQRRPPLLDRVLRNRPQPLEALHRAGGHWFTGNLKPTTLETRSLEILRLMSSSHFGAEC